MAAEPTAPRPLLCRVFSFRFREPLLVIPYLISLLAAAPSLFYHSYASFLHSFARSLAAASPSPACAKSTYASPAAPCCDDIDVVDADEENEELRKEEVEAIMACIGLGVSGQGEGLRTSMGRAEVSRPFDAEEPSFAEVRRAFAVFDGDKDGLIGAADLRSALARLGFFEDDAACEAMIAAAGAGCGGMNLFQFVRFLEDGLC